MLFGKCKEVDNCFFVGWAISRCLSTTPHHMVNICYFNFR